MTLPALPAWDDDTGMVEWIFAHLREQDGKRTEADWENYRDWAGWEIDMRRLDELKPQGETDFERAMWYADHWEFRPLRALYREIAQWINEPRLKKGQRPPRNAFRIDWAGKATRQQLAVFIAVDDVDRIKRLWRQYHPEHRNRSRDLISAAKIAVKYAKEMGRKVTVDQVERGVRRYPVGRRISSRP